MPTWRRRPPQVVHRTPCRAIGPLFAFLSNLCRRAGCAHVLPHGDAVQVGAFTRRWGSCPARASWWRILPGFSVHSAPAPAPPRHWAHVNCSDAACAQHKLHLEASEIAMPYTCTPVSLDQIKLENAAPASDAARRCCNIQTGRRCSIWYQQKQQIQTSKCFTAKVPNNDMSANFVQVVQLVADCFVSKIHF